MPRNLTKTERTCPECSHAFGAVAKHCICPECKHRFFAVDPATLPPSPDGTPTPDLSAEYIAALDAFDAQIAVAVGAGTRARFSAYELDSSGNPNDNINDVAIRGHVCITASATCSGSESQSFRSELLLDPTWLELCVVLHAQIQSTRDRQHVFLEGVSRTGESYDFDGTPATAYELDLGS